MQKICLKDFLMCLSGNFVADFEQTSYRKLYLEPCQTSKVVKIFILAKKFYLRYFKGSWIRLWIFASLTSEWCELLSHNIVTILLL